MNTFYAVTAGWSAAFALFVIWRLFRCRHHWELVDKTEMDSRLETIMKTTGQFSYAFSSEITSAAYRRVILAMRCSKCGRAVIHKIDSA